MSSSSSKTTDRELPPPQPGSGAGKPKPWLRKRPTPVSTSSSTSTKTDVDDGDVEEEEDEPEIEEKDRVSSRQLAIQKRDKRLQQPLNERFRIHYPQPVFGYTAPSDEIPSFPLFIEQLYLGRRNTLHEGELDVFLSTPRTEANPYVGSAGSSSTSSSSSSSSSTTVANPIPYRAPSLAKHPDELYAQLVYTDAAELTRVSGWERREVFLEWLSVIQELLISNELRFFYVKYWHPWRYREFDSLYRSLYTQSLRVEKPRELPTVLSLAFDVNYNDLNENEKEFVLKRTREALSSKIQPYTDEQLSGALDRRTVSHSNAEYKRKLRSLKEQSVAQQIHNPSDVPSRYLLAITEFMKPDWEKTEYVLRPLALSKLLKPGQKPPLPYSERKKLQSEYDSFYVSNDDGTVRAKMTPETYWLMPEHYRKLIAVITVEQLTGILVYLEEEHKRVKRADLVKEVTVEETDSKQEKGRKQSQLNAFVQDYVVQEQLEKAKAATSNVRNVEANDTKALAVHNPKSHNLLEVFEYKRRSSSTSSSSSSSFAKTKEPEFHLIYQPRMDNDRHTNDWTYEFAYRSDRKNDRFDDSFRPWNSNAIDQKYSKQLQNSLVNRRQGLLLATAPFTTGKGNPSFMILNATAELCLLYTEFVFLEEHFSDAPLKFVKELIDHEKLRITEYTKDPFVYNRALSRANDIRYRRVDWYHPILLNASLPPDRMNRALEIMTAKGILLQDQGFTAAYGYKGKKAKGSIHVYEHSWSLNHLGLPLIVESLFQSEPMRTRGTVGRAPGTLIRRLEDCLKKVKPLADHIRQHIFSDFERFSLASVPSEHITFKQVTDSLPRFTSRDPFSFFNAPFER